MRQNLLHPFVTHFTQKLFMKCQPHPYRAPRFPKKLRANLSRFIWVSSLIVIGVSEAYSQSVQEFNRIEVRGAQLVPKKDIQTTCGVFPNTTYRPLDLWAIEECLMSTGVFESVVLTTEEDTLVITVEELTAHQGQIEASIAYASQDGIIGGLSFERYNLFPDTYGSVRLAYNAEVQRARANLYHPNTIGGNFDIGLKATWERLSFDSTSYTQATRQIEAFLSWSPTTKTQIETGVGYRSYALSDVKLDAGPLLQLEETENIDAPFLRFGIQYSSLSRSDTAWGVWAYSMQTNQYLWNLGTDDELSEFRHSSRIYIPLGNNLRTLVSVEAGRVSGLNGNATRVIDRFMLGADNFRGFAPRGVGPNDNGQALGGNTYAVSSVELQRNFNGITNTPLVGGLFWEAGTTWGLDNDLNGTIDDRYRARSSIGVSLSFDIGNAPVALYFAAPIQKEAGDKTQYFGISVSARF